MVSAQRQGILSLRACVLELRLPRVKPLPREAPSSGVWHIRAHDVLAYMISVRLSRTDRCARLGRRGCRYLRVARSAQVSSDTSTLIRSPASVTLPPFSVLRARASLRLVSPARWCYVLRGVAAGAGKDSHKALGYRMRGWSYAAPNVLTLGGNRISSYAALLLERLAGAGLAVHGKRNEDACTSAHTRNPCGSSSAAGLACLTTTTTTPCGWTCLRRASDG
ncbi:hypothetical protein C8J57DRAFT_147665 [Mycena rebaudengoi]|nr:hypothetical protein C8J57DRAFT_147665 [Mycena rebaudengoi]